MHFAWPVSTEKGKYYHQSVPLFFWFFYFFLWSLGPSSIWGGPSSNEDELCNPRWTSAITSSRYPSRELFGGTVR